MENHAMEVAQVLMAMLIIVAMPIADDKLYGHRWSKWTNPTKVHV
jgi:hypothetical protein